MPTPFPAETFCDNYNGVEMLIKFIEMSNEPKIPNKDIAEEFNISEATVTYWQRRLGNFIFRANEDIIEYIEGKIDSLKIRQKKQTEFVQKQRAIILRPDFRKTSDKSK